MWKMISFLFWLVYGCLIFLKLIIGVLSLEQSPIPIKGFVVQTASMEPFIYPGDVIFVRSRLPEDLRVRDVVTFRDTLGHVITHRITQTIVENGSWQFVTKGDNNNAEDSGVVRADQIVGEYFLGVSQLGYVLVAMGRPTGMFLMIVMPALVLLLEGRSKQQTKKSEFQLV